MKLRRAWVVVGALMATSAAWGQASAMPSAQAAPGAQGVDRGRKLMDEMVTALGGDAWLNRQDWKIQGRAATFYKGAPHEEAPAFEEYYRTRPFGERVVIVSHYGIFFATDHSDIAEVWTADNGYEVTFKGKKALPEKDVAEYMRRRKYSLETVVQDWLKQPGTEVTYDGTNMEARHLADKVSVRTAANDGVTLELDQTTHLPLSLTFQTRDPVYHDLNTDVEQFDDYHLVQGIQTPYAITRLHNGDMVGQRFVTKVAYNMALPADLFDPDRPLTKSTKK